MRGKHVALIRARSYSSLPLLLPALLFLFSCQTAPPRTEIRDRLARGEDDLVHRRYHGAIATFQEVLDTTSDPDLRGSALLGLGKAYTALGHSKEAFEFLYRAQREQPKPATAAAIEIALGEAYFEGGDYSRAYRSLARVVNRSGADAQRRLLAVAGICAHKLGDHEAGKRLMRRARLDRDRELMALVERHIPDYRERERSSWGDRVVTPRKPRATTPRDPGPLKVYSRRHWRARSIRANRTVMSRPYRITVHHSGTDEPEIPSFAEAAETIRKIQQNHQGSRGWADIGYHFVIDRSGRIWEGRSLRYQGAHARGDANRGNIGVVLLGNLTRQRVTPAQARSLGRFLAYLCQRHRVSASRVYTHAEILDGATACPGPQVARLIRNFRNAPLAFNRP